MSTVTGIIKNPDGTARSVELEFVPRSTPLNEGSTIISTRTVRVRTAYNGAFSIVLEQGDYGVFWADNELSISVPNDDNTYGIDALLSVPLTYSYTTPPSGTFTGPTATPSVLGAVKLVATDATATVITNAYLQQYLAICDSMADLSSITNSANNKIAVLTGYDTPGDGGGGLFHWRGASTATANAATVVIPDGQDPGTPGRWHRLFDF